MHDFGKRGDGGPLGVGREGEVHQPGAFLITVATADLLSCFMLLRALRSGSSSDSLRVSLSLTPTLALKVRYTHAHFDRR